MWFAANQHALAQQLSRPALLRLKFSKLDEAERLLAEASIVPRSTAGKRYEMYCSEFFGGRGGRERSPAAGPSDNGHLDRRARLAAAMSGR